MNGMTFGEKLLMLRKSRGMSQENLADELEVSRQAISRWEVGDTMPEVKYVVALSKFFGVTTDYLLCEEPQQSNGTVTGTEHPSMPVLDPRQRTLRTLMRSGIASAITGILGILILAITSCFVEVPYVQKTSHSNGWTTYTGTQGYNFPGFIEHHHLRWLVILLAIMAIAGILCCCYVWKNRKNVQNED